MFLPVFLLACGAPAPLVTSVDPAEVSAGASIKILGQNFAEGATVSLAADAAGDGVALAGVAVQGVVLIEALVPEGVSGGTYDLKVTVDGRSHTLPKALTVVVPKVDVPCAGDYTANTQLSLARKQLVVDRFFRTGERETLRLSLAEITRVEYELVRMDDSRLCSVIFVRTSDDARVMFDDDTEVDLKQRAYKMARDMGKPIEVTREDAPDMGKPAEPN